VADIAGAGEPLGKDETVVVTVHRRSEAFGTDIWMLADRGRLVFVGLPRVYSHLPSAPGRRRELCQGIPRGDSLALRRSQHWRSSRRTSVSPQRTFPMPWGKILDNGPYSCGADFRIEALRFYEEIRGDLDK
jgi:hypothetical protein